MGATRFELRPIQVHYYPVRRRFLLIDILAAAVVVGGIAAVAVIALHHNNGPKPTPFPTQQITAAASPSPSSSPALLALGDWPTYGYDAARTRFNPDIRLRPPYRVKWRFLAHDLLEFPPSIIQGSLYFCSEYGNVYCLNADTAKVLWKYHVERAKFASTPAIAGQVVYVTSIGGLLIALDRHTGKRLWQVAGIGPIESSPLVWNGRVFFGSLDHHIYAVSIATHKVVWRVATGGPVKGSAAEANGRIVIGSYDGAVYCLNFAGHLLWRHSTSGLLSSNTFYATPSIAYNTVYVGGTGDRIYALDLTNGGQRWSFTTGGYVYSSPAVWRNLIFEGSYDGYFYALGAATGRVVWRFYAGGPISGSPTVLNGVVYLSSFTHRTYGISARTGRQLWRFNDGEYSPVTADSKTLYLNGFHTLYALTPKG